jgi:RNA polymerase sigma-70 factor (ECF subfamily)
MDTQNTTRDEEKAWLQRVCNGEAEAYAHLVERYQGALIGFIFNLVRNMDQAQDLAQETFLKAYKNIRGFDGAASFSTWLFAIAKNGCYDVLRRNKWKSEEIDEEHPAFQAEAPQDGHVQGARFRKVLETGLSKLNADCRMAFELILVEGFSYDEAATILKTNSGTVRSRVHRARGHLQKVLKDFSLRG